MVNTDGDKLLAVIGVLLITFATAFLVPALIISIETPTDKTLTQTEGETVTVTHDLEALLIDVDNNNGDIAVNVTDLVTGETAAITDLAVGNSETVTLHSHDITVTNDGDISNSEAVVSYQYPVYHGWPDGAKTVFDNLAGIIMAAIVLIIMGLIFVLIEVFR